MFFLIKRLIRLWRARRPRVAQPGSAMALAASGSPDAISPAARGPLALVLHEAAYDLRISLRSPRARFMGIVFPIVLLVIFVGVFGNDHTLVDGATVSLKVFYVPGILAMSIVVNAYASLVISISGLRETGVLKRRRATPVPATVLIVGQALATVVNTAITATILLLVARLLYGVGFAGAALAAVACTTLVGTLAFACIGYAVSGLIGSQEAAQPTVQMTMLPLWFISGVFIPITNLSPALRDLADVFPVQHLANSLHLASVHTSFGASISATDMLVLAAWALGAGVFCAWRFSWLPAGASR
jgi:ABC-2 type transport system permease protein